MIYAKKIISILFYCFFSLFLCAAEYFAPNPDERSYQVLEKAFFAFENKNYADAFHAVEKAKDLKKKECQWALDVIHKSLKQVSIIKLGTNIPSIMEHLAERKDKQVLAVLNNILEKKDLEFFNYNIENILSYIDLHKNYPEADYLLGKLYVEEGELNTAFTFYKQAYNYRQLLEIPDFHFDILYAMAELFDLQAKLAEYEEILLIIASYNTSYKTNGKNSAFLNAILNAQIQHAEVDKFYLLYRNNFYKTMKAFFLLTRYYYDYGYYDKAYETALLFSLQVATHLDEVFKSKDIHYSYDSFENLLKKGLFYSDVYQWTLKNNIWEGLYLLGKLSVLKNHSDFAKMLFNDLVNTTPQKNVLILSKKELINLN